MAKVSPSYYDGEFGSEPSVAATPSATTVGPAHAPVKLFDVTCVVGSVYDGGTQPPRIAAFEMIASHDADGTFTFPDEDGRIIEVTVNTRLATQHDA